MPSLTGNEIVVVGIGAMGGGMARALLASPVAQIVCGYDRSLDAVEKFLQEATKANKTRRPHGQRQQQQHEPSELLVPPTTLSEAITETTDFVILSLVNESQCDQVCFGSTEPNLLTILPKGSCVILTSTVTATWAKKASQKFQSANILFVDCPVSGGPARALTGELTMMASGDSDSLEVAQPVLDALGKDVHIISGGPGAGSTVKCVHQLLAGVHICAAAEAMAMAAKAGLDVEQLYRIVNGAAGASWMFTDRGKRMLDMDPVQVNSALDIFVKDLDIVYSEAKHLQSPIPVASAALQQFISGQSMGLGRMDDSQVVKVYERITGAPVARKQITMGTNVGDYWTLPDGTTEQIVDIAHEPKHHLVLVNEYARVFDAVIPIHDATQCHRHSEDSLFIFLGLPGIDVRDCVQGASAPRADRMEFGEIRHGLFKTNQTPLVHKLCNTGEVALRCIDIELLTRPPIAAANPMVAEHHELVQTSVLWRVYKLTLQPGETVATTYPFFYCSVVLRTAEVETEVSGGIRWKRILEVGDVQWKEPVFGLKQTNVDKSSFEQYIVEWL